jgi:branched-chain amino acid transport system substrate-binding protein
VKSTITEPGGYGGVEPIPNRSTRKTICACSRSHFLAWRAVFFILLLALFACETEKPPLKIGFVGELTGRYSDLGTAGRNGVILAVEEVNQAGGVNGRTVKLIIRDDRHDPERAVKMDEELIREGVAALIGHTTSTTAMAALPVINREEILMISPTASSSRLAGKNDWFFRVCGDVTRTGRRLAEYAFHDSGVRRVTAVYDLDNPDYTQSYVEAFSSRFEELGGRVILAQGYDSGTEARFHRLAEQVAASLCDGVLIVGSALDTAMVCQQIRKLDPDIFLFSSGWGMTSEFLSNAGRAAEGVFFTWFFDWDSQSRSYVDFKDKFTARFGKEPDFAALFGYEAAGVLFDGLAETTDPKALRENILKHKEFKGLQGHFELDEYGDARRPVFVITVTESRFKTVE